MSKLEEIKLSDIKVQFQTPKPICKYMVSLIPEGVVTVLEPTPGIGNLVEALKGYDVTTPEDFFLLDRSQRFDCVCMNPPFSSRYAFGVPVHLKDYGMRLGYFMLLSCMEMSDNIIALMPWFTIADSDLRLNVLKNWGIKSITALPRSTFSYVRVQTMVLEMKKGFAGDTIMKVFQPRHKSQIPIKF